MVGIYGALWCLCSAFYKIKTYHQTQPSMCWYNRRYTTLNVAIGVKLDVVFSFVKASNSISVKPTHLAQSRHSCILGISKSKSKIINLYVWLDK